MRTPLLISQVTMQSPINIQNYTWIRIDISNTSLVYFRALGSSTWRPLLIFSAIINVLGLSIGIPLALKADLGTIGLWSGLAIGNVIQVKSAWHKSGIMWTHAKLHWLSPEKEKNYISRSRLSYSPAKFYLGQVRIKLLNFNFHSRLPEFHQWTARH